MKEENMTLELYVALDKAYCKAWDLSVKYPSNENWDTFVKVSCLYHDVKAEYEKTQNSVKRQKYRVER